MPDRVHYQINECLSCGMVFSSPIFKEIEIAKFYKESICTYGEQVPYLIKTYMPIFEKIRENLPKNPKVLEIGCGNGFFLKALQDRNVKEVYGVEPSSTMVKEANPHIRKRIITDVFKKNQFGKESFDAVVCFHTLDHLTDPSMVVAEMYRITKKGGYVVIVVHDTRGLSVRLFGEHSPIFDIEHIYLFNKNTLAQLFASGGFRDINVENLVNTYPMNYWVRMSGIPRLIKEIILYVLEITGLGKLEIPLKGGNIFLLAQKELKMKNEK